MGWCHDFDVEIAEGCSHPMRAGVSYCTCTECGVVCHGKFDGCKEVWIQLPSRVKRTGGDAKRGKQGARARPHSEPARTIRLTEPMEVPESGAHYSPAQSAVTPSSLDSTATTDVSQRGQIESLTPAIAEAVRSAVGRQAATNDARLAELRGELERLHESSSTTVVRIVDRLKEAFARRDEEIEVRFSSYQADFDSLRMAVQDLVERSRSDPRPPEQRGTDQSGRAATPELVVALARRTEQLEARFSSFQSVLDGLHHAVRDLAERDDIRRRRSELGHDGRPDAAGDSAGDVLRRLHDLENRLPDAEVTELRKELGRLRDEFQSTNESLRQSLDEAVRTAADQREVLRAELEAELGPQLSSELAARLVGTDQSALDELKAIVEELEPNRQAFDVGLSSLRQELARFRDETRVAGDRFRRSMEERVRTVVGREDELGARIAAQQAVIDDLRSVAASLVASLDDFLPRSFVEESLPDIVHEVVAAAIRAATGPEGLGEEDWNEGAGQAITEMSGPSEDILRFQTDLRNEMAARQIRLENTLNAQDRALLALRATVAELVADRDRRGAERRRPLGDTPPRPRATTDPDLTRAVGQGFEGRSRASRRGEVSALLGERWGADVPAQEGDRATPD